MLYTPGRLGRTRIGDFLDAMAGYNEGESEKTKSIAGLIRRATTILLNIQLAKEDRLTPHELWPLPWDKDIEGGKVEVLSEEEVKRREDAMEKILNGILPNCPPLGGLTGGS